MSRQDTIGTHKTAVYTDSDGSTCVQYHATVVAKRGAGGGTVTLNSGGWRTVTTKARMNQALRTWNPDKHWGVFQRKGEWFVSFYSGAPTHEHINEMEYHDSMVLST
jgi:hypothetical protein